MATKTAGSNTTTNLTAVQWTGQYGASSIADADIATIANAIINDADPPTILPGAFSRMGLLYVPRRGILQMKDGDWVATDASGFPYLIPRISMPGTLTILGTTNTTKTLVMATSALAAGWRVGTVLSGSAGDIPAGTTIAAISLDGLTITLSAAATGSNAGQTITAGTFSHS